MTDVETVEHLQELGLTEYQSRAYLAAVTFGRGTPSDLSEESGVPQARIYDVIDGLQDLGLVEIHSQKQGKEVTAPSPQTVLRQFERRRTEELSNRVSTAIADLEGIYHRFEENPDSFITMVSREESAMRHVRRAVEKAEWWLTISIEGHLYPEIRDLIADALDRSVTVRLLLNEENPELEQYSFPPSLRVRHRKTADTIIAADRAYGIFNSKHPARSGQPYIITQERNLVLLFQNYSEQIWPTSKVVQEGTEFSRRYLDPWHAIIDLRDRFDRGEELYATVRGTDTSTHRKDTWEGRIGDYELSGPVEADFVTSMPVEASLVIETDHGPMTVGGWKATLEDIATDGIEISPS